MRGSRPNTKSITPGSQPGIAGAASFLQSLCFAALLLLPAASVLARTSGNQPTASHPEQIQKDLLIVGSEQDFPPFATGMTDDTAGGFTVDLWKAVAAESGLNYTLRVRPFHQLLKEFKDGKIDVLINLAQSEERHRFADFTVPHVVVHGAIFVRKGSDIRSEADLAGRSIIVLNADLAHDYAVSKGWEKQLVLVDTAAEGFSLLAAGRHDAMLLSKLAGMQTLQQLELEGIVALKAKTGFSQKFSFAVHEGQSVLLGRINEGLALTKTNGSYNKLYDKWFGIYEDREIDWHDLLNYLVPLFAVFLAATLFLNHRRQIERRKNEFALRESESRFRLMADSAPVLIWVSGTNKLCIWFNKVWLEFTGRTMDMELGNGWAAGVHPDDYQRCLDTYSESFDARKRFTMEYRLRRHDGQYRWLIDSGVPRFDEAGAFTGYIGSCIDITDRKLNEEALQESEQRYHFLFSNNPLPMWVYEQSTLRFLVVNDQAVEQYGYTREEFGRMTLRDIRPEEDIADLEQAAADPKMQRRSSEWRHRRKDGTIINVIVSTVPMRYGAIPARIALVQDITGRKKAEKELRESEKRFRQLFEKAPIGIAIAKAGQQIITANDAYCRMFGYTQEELNRMTIASLTHPDYAGINRRLAEAVLRGDVPACSHETRYLRKDQPPFWGQLVLTAIAGQNPQEHYIMEMVEDITERAERERLRLDEVREQRDLLVREVHHRIKNNLQGVVGLLRQHATDHPELVEVIEMIIGRIYSIAIIHGLQAETLSEDVDLGILIRNIVDAAGSNVQYRSGLQQPVLLKREEAVPIALVLNELITNACKHRLANSTVDISLETTGNTAVINITNTFGADSVPRASGGQGLKLIRSLLPTESAELTVRSEGDVYMVELKLSQPVTISKPEAAQ